MSLAAHLTAAGSASQLQCAAVCQIPLSKGRVAQVDAADFEWLNQWKWQINKGRYATRPRRRGDGPGGGLIAMHRQLMQPAAGLVVDHINGDGLDNRRANLRVCHQTENVRNRRPLDGNATGFKGVVYLPDIHKYRAYVRADGRSQNSATYCTAIAAALAYDAMARELHGEFAGLNFPDLVMPWDWRAGTQPRRQPRFRQLVARQAISASDTAAFLESA